MARLSASASAAIALALLTMLSGCARPGRDPEFDKGNLFEPDPDGPDKMSRTFECLQRDSEGNCLANKCTEGPGGETYNCGSFAKACIDADLHWSGTQAGGTCSVPL